MICSHYLQSFCKNSLQILPIFYIPIISDKFLKMEADSHPEEHSETVECSGNNLTQTETQSSYSPTENSKEHSPVIVVSTN